MSTEYVDFSSMKCADLVSMSIMPISLCSL